LELAVELAVELDVELDVEIAVELACGREEPAMVDAGKSRSCRSVRFYLTECIY